jgi:hypothetical protein
MEGRSREASRRFVELRKTRPGLRTNELAKAMGSRMSLKERRKVPPRQLDLVALRLPVKNGKGEASSNDRYLRIATAAST